MVSGERLPVSMSTAEVNNALLGNTLRAHAAHLVVEGKTTVDEALRISNQFDDV